MKLMSILLSMIAALFVVGGLVGFYLQWTLLRCVLSVVTGLVFATLGWSSLKKEGGFLM